MEIKPCAHCGDEPTIQEIRGGDLSAYPFRVLCGCGMATIRYRLKEIAIDVWNARHEANPSEADRWLKEATEQRARADRLEAERDEMAEYVEAIKRSLVYAGKTE